MPPPVIAGAIIAAGTVVGSVGSSVVAAESAKKAAGAQARAAERAAEVQLQAQREAITAQREMFDITREDLAPYREIGTGALQQLRSLTVPGRYLAQEFDYSAEDFEADPGYQFRLSEGMKALERSAAARGTLLSGRQIKDITRFGQDLASEEYGRAYTRSFNEFMANRANRFNRLAALAGIGQTSTTTTAQLGQQTGANIGQTYLTSGARLADIGLQAGNVRASGYAAQGQAYGQALQNISQLPLQYYTLKSLGAFK